MSGWSQREWQRSLADLGLGPKAVGYWLASRADHGTGLLPEWITATLAIDETGIPRATFYRAISALKEAGLLDGSSGDWTLITTPECPASETPESHQRDGSVPPARQSHSETSHQRDTFVPPAGHPVSHQRDSLLSLPRVSPSPVEPTTSTRFAEARRRMAEAWEDLSGSPLALPTSRLADVVAAVQVAAGRGDLTLDDDSDEAVSLLVADAWVHSITSDMNPAPGRPKPRLDRVLQWHRLSAWAKNGGATAVEAIGDLRAATIQAQPKRKLVICESTW